MTKKKLVKILGMCQEVCDSNEVDPLDQITVAVYLLLAAHMNADCEKGAGRHAAERIYDLVKTICCDCGGICGGAPELQTIHNELVEKFGGKI